MYKRLLKYVKPYRKRMAGALICMVLVAGLTTFAMWLIKPMVNKILVEKAYSKLLFLSGIILLVYVARGVFYYIQAYSISYVGQKVVFTLRNELYAKFQSLSLNFFTKTPTGEIMARLTNDLRFVQEAVSKVIGNIIRNGLTVVGLISLLFWLHWRLAIVTLVVAPLAAIAVTKFGQKMRKVSRRCQEKMADIYSVLQETITGIKITRAFNRQEYEIDHIRRENQHFFNAMMKGARITSLQDPVMEFIGALAIVILFIYGGYEICKETMSIGTFFAFLGSMFQIYASGKTFAGLNVKIQQASAAGERIFKILSLPSETAQPGGKMILLRKSHEIVFHNVSFSYDREKILDYINFRVEAGKVVALVGPSGAGKTSIVNLILRFYNPDDGYISVDGQNIANIEIKSLREQIGIVTQETILFNDTVRNNIAYGKLEATDREIIQAAITANAHDFILQFPQQYETRIGERGTRLSGGQAQRIAIARAVLKNPPILLLDEATSSLDTESEKLVQEALDHLMHNRTTLVIAHRLSTVRKADKIVVIDQGKILQQGKHAELMEEGGLYKRLYELQFP